MDRPIILVIAILVLLGNAGCSVKNMATNAVADAMAGSGDVYGADNDVAFVGEASPFGLKMMESLLEEVPKHRGLLLASARGFTQYAYAYIEQPANELEEKDVNAAYLERDRARRMYIRARNYGVRGLAVGHPEVNEKILIHPEAAFSEMRVEDVPLLYWTAAAWASAISLGKDDAALVADLPVVAALILRAYELDESFNEGAIHSFLISYEMSKPGANQENVKTAREYFEHAVSNSNNTQAAPYLSLAEAVSIFNQDRKEFELLLKQALAIDVAAKPEQRLANLVMQRRARWLLKNSDNYFLE